MIIKKITADLLEARKSRDAGKASILSTALGEMSNHAVMTNGEKIVSDDKAISIIKKFIGAIDETLELVSNEKKELLNREREILSGYLPTMLSEAELTDIIRSAVDGGGANIGSIMGLLKSKYANLYDGKTASKIANELLKGV